MKSLTVQRLRELLDYDPETGVFRWRVSRGRVAQGSVAGAISGGYYRQIFIDYESHRANRLAWLYMTGVWPANQIDHKNGDTVDDRFANLREATGVQNQRNSRTPRTNTSGFKGVYFHKQVGRWAADIRHAGKRRYLGCFDTAAEAHAAYCKAAIEIDPEFARLA